MNKKQALLFLSVGLANLMPIVVSAVTVKNPINYNNFCALLTKGIIPGVASIIGVLGTLMILISGFLFMTSAGNPEKLGKAKKALGYAVMGLILAGLAEAIVLVIQSVLGAVGKC